MQRFDVRAHRCGSRGRLEHSRFVPWMTRVALALGLALALGQPGPAQAGFPFPDLPPQPDDVPTVLTPPDLPPGGRAALCLMRDAALEHADDLAQKLGLLNLFRNYYCDGGCFMCCKIAGNAGCHSSFDYGDDGLPPINCSPGTYGAPTSIVGEALVTGDPTGTGICLAVQQLCNHFPVCSGDAGTPAAATAIGPGAAPTPTLVGAADADGAAATGSAGSTAAAPTSSPPPHPDMTLPGAVGSRAKAFTKAILHAFTENVKQRAPGTSLRDYVDFTTARGARRWQAAMRDIEPYSENYSVFRVEDASGVLLPEDSYQLGILYHAELGLLGAVPNVLTRLAYVESRYWTEDEILEYLGGVDPETELRKTMGPLAFEALKQVPIQDWRLLAVPAPNEPPIVGRSYEGFELGQAPSVSVALDCADPGETRLALRVDDPEQAYALDSLYPVIVSWGDGSQTETVYDRSLASNVVSHVYAEPGVHVASVTASNVTGLRGIASIVVDAPIGSDVPNPPALSSISLDPVQAFGPALIRAGDLSVELDLRRADGSVVEAGFSEKVTLPNAGSIPLHGMIAYHESQSSLEALVLRPTSAGGYYYDSVYLKAPSLTLGFFDSELGLVVTRTLPLTEDMLEVYYEGASAPVDPALLERDRNGALILPVDRGNAALAAGFCGATACKRVDRIEIPITKALLDTRPASSPVVPSGLVAGDVAHWVEDVPNTFIADPDTSSTSIASSCGGSLSVGFVAADEPAGSRVGSISIEGGAPAVVDGLAAPLHASATLVDGRVVDVTDRVTWSSSDPTVLTISNGLDKGLVSAATLPGTATIEARLGDVAASVVALNASAPRGYQTYRFQITEIHGAAGHAGLNAVELFVDDVLLENKMTSLVDGTFGPFPADIASVSGGNAVTAFDASFGTAWNSPTNSFVTTAPYVVSGSPVYLEVAFEQPTPLSGIRLHRQAGVLSISFLPQFPKQVVVEGSNDGTNFETVTTFDVAGWDYQPLEIPIPVAVPEPGLLIQVTVGAFGLAWGVRRRAPMAWR